MIKRIAPAIGMTLLLALGGCNAADTGPTDRGGEGPAQGSGGRPPMPDFSAAAQSLGITEDALHAAMRNAGGPPPDLAKVAAELGIDEATLRAALPEPPRRRG